MSAGATSKIVIFPCDANRGSRGKIAEASAGTKFKIKIPVIVEDRTESKALAVATQNMLQAYPIFNSPDLKFEQIAVLTDDSRIVPNGRTKSGRTGRRERPDCCTYTIAFSRTFTCQVSQRCIDRRWLDNKAFTSGARCWGDIFAGRGTFGLDAPRLCVQVKSQSTPADVTVYRILQGSMQTFKADQGLLVCWSGFNKVVQSEAKQGHFTVRLCDGSDLVEAIYRNYEKLPAEVQAELPLKRVWMLVTESDEE